MQVDLMRCSQFRKISRAITAPRYCRKHCSSFATKDTLQQTVSYEGSKRLNLGNFNVRWKTIPASTAVTAWDHCSGMFSVQGNRITATGIYFAGDGRGYEDFKRYTACMGCCRGNESKSVV